MFKPTIITRGRNKRDNHVPWVYVAPAWTRTPEFREKVRFYRERARRREREAADRMEEDLWGDMENRDA